LEKRAIKIAAKAEAIVIIQSTFEAKMPEEEKVRRRRESRGEERRAL
jgi:hypothetical protein